MKLCTITDARPKWFAHKMSFIKCLLSKFCFTIKNINSNILKCFVDCIEILENVNNTWSKKREHKI